MNKDTEERLLVEMVEMEKKQALLAKLATRGLSLNHREHLLIDLDTSRFMTPDSLAKVREIFSKGEATCMVLDSCAEGIKASLQNIPKEITLGIMNRDTYRIVESEPWASTHKPKRPYGPLEKGKGGKTKRW